MGQFVVRTGGDNTYVLTSISLRNGLQPAPQTEGFSNFPNLQDIRKIRKIRKNRKTLGFLVFP